jgi:hypothetical protein
MQSENIDKLAEALAKAQGQIKNPSKNRKVTVTTRTGGRYEFEYADLTAIIEAIKKPLSENNIGYLQDVELVDGKFRLVTTLMHASGQFRSSNWPLFLDQIDRDGNPVPPTSQSFGSALTFMKRYALAAITGVAADSDDDANTASGNEAQVARKPKMPSSPSPVIKPKELATKPRVEPHPLPPPHGDKWIDWGRTFLETMTVAPEDDRTLWLMLNTERLRALSMEAPKVFQRLEGALAALGVDKDILSKLGDNNEQAKNAETPRS